MSGSFNITRSEAFNYLSKPSAEPIRKCDNVDKLQALWQDTVASFPEEPLKAGAAAYVNDRPVTFNINHYESPIKLRHASVTSNSENDLKTPTTERPQSYIDMAGKKPSGQDDLLLFNNVDRVNHDERTPNGISK